MIKFILKKAFDILKYDYLELNFDIFFLDGADNINQLLIWIKSSFEMFDKSKKYISLFYCDEKGKSIIGINAKRKKYVSIGKSKNMYKDDIIKQAYIKAINFITTDINKNKIEKEVKNILADYCKNFIITYFKHFKKLFDMIKDIKNLN